MSTLRLSATQGKPVSQPAQRATLLDLRVSAGLSVAAIFLRDFLKARPDAALADCHRAARIIAAYTVAEVPGHVAVEDVVEVLDVIRQKGGRHAHE